MTGFVQWLDTVFAGFDKALPGMYHALAEAAVLGVLLVDAFVRYILSKVKKA